MEREMEKDFGIIDTKPGSVTFGISRGDPTFIEGARVI